MEEADTLNIKFGFSLSIKFSPLYKFLKNLSFIKVKGDLATETNEDNDFTTVIHIVIILCFIEHLCYPQGPAEMFSNVYILMECYLKLSPDVYYSDFYSLCLLLPNWLAQCFQT